MIQNLNKNYNSISNWKSTIENLRLKIKFNFSYLLNFMLFETSRIILENMIIFLTLTLILNCKATYSTFKKMYALQGCFYLIKNSVK